MSMVLLFTIEGLDLARNNSDSQMFKTIAGIFIGLSYGSVALLGVFMIYIHRTNEKINGLLDLSKKLGILQKQHYESLLEKEEETRKYRHDMMNHMVYMNGLAKKKESEKIYEYINELMTELETIQKKKINTGNDVIDIMTNHYIELLDKKVSISVTGEINPKIDDLKLCIIYGNILQNAIEELAQCGSEAWLRVRLEQGREYCVITIENSLSGKTSKKRIQSDLKDHGIGLQNVKLVVDELNGKIETKKGNDYYHISVSLPL
jgi:sensor histidine kinase regulating citrate/malate metabolism